MLNKAKYKSPEVGQEITCVFEIENSAVLNNKNGILKQWLAEALTNDNFGIISWLEHHFAPEGYSCLVLLKESHAALHTYPEHNSLVFNMYSCRGEDDVAKTFEYFKKKLKPAKIISYREGKIPVTIKSAKIIN